MKQILTNTSLKNLLLIVLVAFVSAPIYASASLKSHQQFECFDDLYEFSSIDISKDKTFIWAASENLYGPSRPAASVRVLLSKSFKCRDPDSKKKTPEAINRRLNASDTKKLDLKHGTWNQTLYHTIWLSENQYYQADNKNHKWINLSTITDGINEPVVCTLATTKSDHEKITRFIVSDDSQWILYSLTHPYSKTISEDDAYGLVYDDINTLPISNYIDSRNTLVVVKAWQSCDGNHESPAKHEYVIPLDPSYQPKSESKFALTTFKEWMVIGYRTGVTRLTSVDTDVIVEILSIKDGELHQVGSSINVSNRQSNLDGMDTDIKISPEGKHVSFIKRDNPQDEAARESIQIVELSLKEARILQQFNIDFFNNPIISYEWSCNGDCLLVLIQTAGETKLYQVGQPGLSITEENWSKAVEVLQFLKHDHRYLSTDTHNGISRQFAENFVVSADGLTINAVVSDLITPPEIYRFSRANSKSETAFTINKKACSRGKPNTASHSLCRTYINDKYESSLGKEYEVTDFSIDTFQGYPVNGYVIAKRQKSNSNTARPAILYVHSGPTGSWPNKFDPRIIELVVAGYAVILANPSGSFGYGYEHVGRSKQAWGTTIREDLQHVINALLIKPEFQYLNLDRSRLAAIGSSFGGYMMSMLAVKPFTDQNGQQIPFKALVSINGIYDLDLWAETTDEQWYPNDQLGREEIRNQSKQLHDPSLLQEELGKNSPPFLLVTSLDDVRVHPDQSIKLFKALRTHCVPARLITFPGEDHSPNVRALQFIQVATVNWFDQFVLGNEREPGVSSKIGKPIEMAARMFVSPPNGDSCLK